MSLLKDMEKMVKFHHIVFLVGVLIIGFALCQYSNKKNTLLSGFTEYSSSSGPSTQNVSNPTGRLAIAPDTAASISGGNSQQVVPPPNCTQMPVLNPADLLPKDSNSQWASLNPPSGGGVGSVNFLNASAQLKSINTIGSSLRNANLQVRSEPPNPQSKVSPWMNSTIEPDLMRAPFEIGCGCPGPSPQ